MLLLRLPLVAALASLPLITGVAAASASSAPNLTDPAHQWMPSGEAATWSWKWSDPYVSKPVDERYTVAKSDGASFELAWTSSSASGSTPSTVDYERTNVGLVNTDWGGSAPPSSMPILCATAGQCGNSLASAHFQLIWGTRSPVLMEPVVQGTSWSTVGGANSDVASDNRYIGQRVVKVPAFPQGVRASGIESEVSQAGALGDPYGSGVRTVWWVYGVGPVRIAFRHTGGELTFAELQQTNLKPLPAPPATSWFPLALNSKAVFDWRNSRWSKKWSRQRFTVSQLTNGTARVDVAHVSGPIRVAGSYVFTRRLDGVTALQGVTRSASLSTFPALGPRRLPAQQRRHLITPYDLMSFGLNPILPGYPKAGQRWSAQRGSRDFKVFGVTGHARVLGLRTVRVPAGRFRALAVLSQLHQAGYRFGSGTRTSYFGAGRGLVKLVFRHADGSVSTVVRVH
jgi:hypothetical protein